jgi:hypothetical protein
MKAILTVILAAVVVVVSAVVLTQSGAYEQSIPEDPIALRKAEILELSSSGKEPTPDVKKAVLEYLSGPAMLQYNFTLEEKIKIVKFLNE